MLAPLPASRTASALALYTFTRSFAQTWGISVASTVLQNQLTRTLPKSFTAQFPQGREIAFAAIPMIGGLPEPLRDQVRAASAHSLSVVWFVMAGVSAAGVSATPPPPFLPFVVGSTAAGRLDANDDDDDNDAAGAAAPGVTSSTVGGPAVLPPSADTCCTYFAGVVPVMPEMVKRPE